jgi:pilus assembly protein CpaB
MNGLLRRLPIILGVAAILVGLGLGGVWLNAPRGVAATRSIPVAGAVLVAARPVEPGALLREADLSWRPLGDAPAPAGAFSQSDTPKGALIGAAVLRGLTPGEVLRADSVVRPDQRNFLAATLGPGLRAVTISVDAPQSASGLVQPGDRVDVILIQQVGEGARRIAAETVLRNNRVLAVGRSLTAEKGIGGVEPPRTITLEASPRDAQRLFLASRMGDLQISLRGVGDIGDDVDAAPVWSGDVSEAAHWRTVPPAAAPGSTPTARTVGPPRTAGASEGSVLVLRGASGAGPS